MFRRPFPTPFLKPQAGNAARVGNRDLRSLVFHRRSEIARSSFRRSRLHSLVIFDEPDEAHG